MEEKNLDVETKEEPAPRPWVAPTFERLPLGEALSGTTGKGSDNSSYS